MYEGSGKVFRLPKIVFIKFWEVETVYRFLLVYIPIFRVVVRTGERRGWREMSKGDAPIPPPFIAVMYGLGYVKGALGGVLWL